MKNDLLEIDVQLLVKRYGLSPVLSAIAELEHQTVDQLEQRIRSLKHRSNVAQRDRKHRQALQEIVDTVASGRSEVLEPLTAIAHNFERRTFLNNLRDVHLFLARLGEPDRSFKSRDLAGPAVVRAIAKLPIDELNQLSKQEGKSSGDSDYSLLSRAIMGRSQKG